VLLFLRVHHALRGDLFDVALLVRVALQEQAEELGQRQGQAHIQGDVGDHLAGLHRHHGVVDELQAGTGSEQAGEWHGATSEHREPPLGGHVQLQGDGVCG